MDAQQIDYDAFKKRGFLRQKQAGYFLLRTRTSFGNYTKDQISALLAISKKYANGVFHTTTRQGIEIPFIAFENIDKVEQEALKAGISMGTSGPRIRSTTTCPGNNWCKSGLINTFAFAERIEKELGVRCGNDLPHKFKISISGCPNKCTRPESSEIGIHGQVDTKDPQKRIGYAVYLGGCGGRTPHLGFKLEKIFSEDEVLRIIEKTVSFYKKNAKFRQRLALLIKDVGRDIFLKEIGIV